jgi:cell division protein FtsI/penicillin-binding protein 2
MSTDTADKQPRGRVIEERARRRRRDDLGMSRHRQLAVDTSKFDPQYTYRIINDDPGRIHALTQQDDWDIVTRSELGDQRDAKEKGVGSAVEFAVDRTGKRGVLVRKPLDYYQADKAKEQAAINDRMKDIRRGKHEGSDALSGPNAYVPEGGISIREGGRG